MNKYGYVNSKRILVGVGIAKCLTDEYNSTDILNIEITDEVFNNWQKYIYQDGEIILDPDYEAKQAAKEAERIARLSLTKREVFLGLYQALGVTPDMIKAQITDPAALIEFEYANDYFRGNPLIDVVGVALGLKPEQLDKFFDTKDYTYLLPTTEESSATETDTDNKTPSDEAEGGVV